MKKSVLISFVLVVLGAGVMAYARYATLSSDTVPAKLEQRLREKAQAGKAYCDKNGYNTNYCFLVDFSIPSGKKRFFEVCKSLCAWIREKQYAVQACIQ